MEHTVGETHDPGNPPERPLKKRKAKTDTAAGDANGSKNGNGEHKFSEQERLTHRMAELDPSGSSLLYAARFPTNSVGTALAIDSSGVRVSGSF